MDNETRPGRLPSRHADDGAALLVVEDLRTYFEVAAGSVRAVDGVSLSLARGRTLGVVGTGKIGRGDADICAKGFDMRVLGYD